MKYKYYLMPFWKSTSSLSYFEIEAIKKISSISENSHVITLHRPHRPYNNVALHSGGGLFIRSHLVLPDKSHRSISCRFFSYLFSRRRCPTYPTVWRKKPCLLFHIDFWCSSPILFSSAEHVCRSLHRQWSSQCQSSPVRPNPPKVVHMIRICILNGT